MPPCNSLVMRRRRSASGAANPRGGSDPYLSSNNEHILDIKFESSLRLDGKESCSYEDIAEAIEEINGVVAHGLVLKDDVTAVVHTPEGAQILRKVFAAPYDASAPRHHWGKCLHLPLQWPPCLRRLPFRSLLDVCMHASGTPARPSISS